MNLSFPVTLILTALFSFPALTNAWTINSNFELGTIGEKAIGKNAMTGAFKYSVFTNEYQNTKSKKAAKFSIDAGTDGWSNWGGTYKFPTKLTEGDQIWFRAYVYFPVGFDYSATGLGLKTMRIHTSSPSGANEGYFDILISNVGGGISIGSEVSSATFYSNNPRSIWENQGTKTPKGVWQALEMYVKFSSVPGNGIFRVWQNGKLIFEDTKSFTLRTASSTSDLIYFFTYWNGNAPKTQSAYIDDVIVTTEIPNKIDSHGNRFIGTKYISPKAPNLNVKQ